MTLIENVMLGAQDQTGERHLAELALAATRRAARSALASPGPWALLEIRQARRTRPRTGAGAFRRPAQTARTRPGDDGGADVCSCSTNPPRGSIRTSSNVIIERILEINRAGVAVLVIEHNMDVIVRLCARVFVMAAGKLLCQGPPDAVVRDPLCHRSLSRRRVRMTSRQPLLVVENLVAGYEPKLPDRQRGVDPCRRRRDRRPAWTEWRGEIDACQGNRRADGDQRRPRAARRAGHHRLAGACDDPRRPRFRSADRKRFARACRSPTI